MKVVVIYYSRGGTTKKMAEIINDQLKKEGVESRLTSIADIMVQELLDYDGIIIGSPTYYGTLAAPIKNFIDESVVLHTKLDGKFGAAFSSSANIAGGNETTVLSILEALLIHGMTIQGDPTGDHYGPVSIGAVDKRCEDNCRRLAKRFAKLGKK